MCETFAFSRAQARHCGNLTLPTDRPLPRPPRRGGKKHFVFFVSLSVCIRAFLFLSFPVLPSLSNVLDAGRVCFAFFSSGRPIRTTERKKEKWGGELVPHRWCLFFCQLFCTRLGTFSPTDIRVHGLLVFFCFVKKGVWSVSVPKKLSMPWFCGSKQTFVCAMRSFGLPLA